MELKQLPIPPAVEKDPKALELIRVWAAHGKQHISLATDIWEDPAAWGILLVDLAKHVALAYQLGSGRNSAVVLKRIKEGFDVEWESPTDEPSGRIYDDA